MRSEVFRFMIDGEVKVVTVETSGETMWLQMHYYRPFIESLKANISKEHREWDPMTKTWIIAPEGREGLEKALRQFCSEDSEGLEKWGRYWAEVEKEKEAQTGEMALERARVFHGERGWRVSATVDGEKKGFDLPDEVFQKAFGGKRPVGVRHTAKVVVENGVITEILEWK